MKRGQRFDPQTEERDAEEHGQTGGRPLILRQAHEESERREAEKELIESQGEQRHREPCFKCVRIISRHQRLPNGVNEQMEHHRAGETGESGRAPQSRAGTHAQNWPVRLLRAPAQNEAPKDERRPGERERQQPKRARTIAPEGQAGKANERINQSGNAGGFEDAGLEEGAHMATLVGEANQESPKSPLSCVPAGSRQEKNNRV